MVGSKHPWKAWLDLSPAIILFVDLYRMADHQYDSHGVYGKLQLFGSCQRPRI